MKVLSFSLFVTVDFIITMGRKFFTITHFNLTKKMLQKKLTPTVIKRIKTL